MTPETQAVIDRVRALRDASRNEGLVYVVAEDGTLVDVIGALDDTLATIEALREDARRLDWLTANPRRLYPCDDGQGDDRWHIDRDGSSGYCSINPRAAIDAARPLTETTDDQ